jgi:hypothetical protein
MCIATLHKDRSPLATLRCYYSRMYISSIPASLGIDVGELEFDFLSLCILVFTISLLHEIKIYEFNNLRI